MLVTFIYIDANLNGDRASSRLVATDSYIGKVQILAPQGTGIQVVILTRTQ